MKYRYFKVNGKLVKRKSVITLKRSLPVKVRMSAKIEDVTNKVRGREL